jgi:peptide/nickel transport system substrate-binding protein
MSLNVSRRAWILRAAAIGVPVAGLTPGFAIAQAQSAGGRVLNIRTNRPFDSFDPAFRGGAMDGNVCRVVYQRLLQYKAGSAELELDAAADIKQVSPTVIEFRLKTGQQFSDGFGEMTADDVKFSIERIIAPPVAGGRPSPYAEDWEGTTVEVKGKYEGRIVLSRARASMFDSIIGNSSGSILSRRAVEQRGASTISMSPVGSGQYVVVSAERQRGVVLRRHTGYNGSRKASINEINYRVIPDAKTTELGLRSGEVDMAVLPVSIGESLRGLPGVSVTIEPGLGFVWLGMNVEKRPLTDIRVRQAIRLALDVDQMIKAGYDGKAPRLNTVVPPQVLGHWRDAPVYRRNVNEAKALLAAAGQSTLRLRITLLNQPEYMNMALVAQALLAEVGITVEIDSQPGGTYWSAGKGDVGKNLDLYIARFGANFDPNFALKWFSKEQIGTWNWSRWANADFDRLFQAAEYEMDRAKRAQLVVDAQRAMDASAAFVWITNEANAVVHRASMRPVGVPGWNDLQFADFTAT